MKIKSHDILLHSIAEKTWWIYMCLHIYKHVYAQLIMDQYMYTTFISLENSSQT